MNQNNKRARVSNSQRTLPLGRDDLSAGPQLHWRYQALQDSYDALKEQKDDLDRSLKGARNIIKQLKAANPNSQSPVPKVDVHLYELAAHRLKTIEEQQNLLAQREATTSQLKDTIDRQMATIAEVKTKHNDETAVVVLKHGALADPRRDNEAKVARLEKINEELRVDYNMEKVRLIQQHDDAIAKLKCKHGQEMARQEAVTAKMKKNFETDKATMAEQQDTLVQDFITNLRKEFESEKAVIAEQHNEAVAGLTKNFDGEKAAVAQHHDNTIAMLKDELAEQKASVLELKDLIAKHEVSNAALNEELNAEKEAVIGHRGTIALLEHTAELQEKVITGTQAKLGLADRGQVDTLRTQPTDLTATKNAPTSRELMLRVWLSEQREW